MLTVKTNVEAACTVTGGGNYTYTNVITVNANPNPGYSFEGWYIGSTRQSTALKWTFSKRYYIDTTLTAKWKLYQRIDASGKPTQSGDYILFGEWPQTLKDDNITIGSEVLEGDYAGYYEGYDANNKFAGYYAKVINAAPNGSNYKFSNIDGPPIVSGQTYYFKVEPLKWRILESAANKAMIICTSIIENIEYDAVNNKYNNGDTHSELNAG